MINLFNEDEIIFVVEMDSNDNKSKEDIENFSKYYTKQVEKNEPNSLGWGFYKSDDKIILIEDQNSTFFVLTGSQNLTSDLSKYLKNIGLKGGGQGNFIMGNNPTKFKLIDLIETYLSSS